MCLAVPGKVIEIVDDEPLARRGRVDFGGVTTEVNLTFVPEAELDDYVLVHVGFAIARIDTGEAARILGDLAAGDALAGPRAVFDIDAAGAKAEPPPAAGAGPPPAAGAEPPPAAGAGPPPAVERDPS